jgi:alpha-tubulin suppressor-like RCC1 family protein
VSSNVRSPRKQAATGDYETSAQVGDVDVGGKVIYVAAGAHHTCAIVEGGDVHCWGNNNYGQLGHSHMRRIGDDETPAEAGDIDLGGVAVQVVAGNHHTCALFNTGKVRCWGIGMYLGTASRENIGDDESPSARVLHIVTPRR